MNKSRFAVAFAVALALMTAGTLNADKLADAKKLVPEASAKLVEEFNLGHKLVLDPGKLECYKEHNAAVTAAQNAFKGCVNNPSAKSPLGKFNALTNAQLATFCGNKTLQECINGVMHDQRVYCEEQTELTEHLNAAAKAEKHCLNCDTLHDKLVALEAEFVKAGCARRLILER